MAHYVFFGKPDKKKDLHIWMCCASIKPDFCRWKIHLGDISAYRS